MSKWTLLLLSMIWYAFTILSLMTGIGKNENITSRPLDSVCCWGSIADINWGYDETDALSLTWSKINVTNQTERVMSYDAIGSEVLWGSKFSSDKVQHLKTPENGIMRLKNVTPDDSGLYEFKVLYASGNKYSDRMKLTALSKENVNCDIPTSTKTVNINNRTEGLDTSYTDNRTNNIQTYFDKILQKAMDYSFFWFGKQFKKTCTSTQIIPKCMDVRGGSPRTLMDLVFGNHSINTNNINRNVTVEYFSPAKTIKACGGSFEYLNTSFTANPLDDKIIGNGYTQSVPTVRWKTKPDELNTLIIYAADENKIHGLYVNINSSYNGTLENEQALVKYQGFVSLADRGSVYTFLLFTQAHYLTVSQAWTVNKSLSHPIVEVIDHLNLTDFVGINWLLSKADAFSIGQNTENLSSPNNCPMLYEDALPTHYKSTNEKLFYYVGVQFSTPSFSFPECCKAVKYPASTIVPDAFSLNTFMPTASARYKPKIFLSERRIGGYTFTNHNDLFALIMVSSELQNRTKVEQDDQTFIHWLNLNIPFDNTTKGDEVLSYIGPMPPSGTIHKYYFLLYKQPAAINATAFAQKYKRDDSGSIEGRSFNLQQMVLKNNFSNVIGTNMFSAKSDEYVTYLNAKEGGNMEVVCNGYLNVCNDASSGKNNVTNPIFLICWWVIILKRYL